MQYTTFSCFHTHTHSPNPHILLGYNNDRAEQLSSYRWAYKSRRSDVINIRCRTKYYTYMKRWWVYERRAQSTCCASDRVWNSQPPAPIQMNSPSVYARGYAVHVTRRWQLGQIPRMNNNRTSCTRVQTSDFVRIRIMHRITISALHVRFFWSKRWPAYTLYVRTPRRSF